MDPSLSNWGFAHAHYDVSNSLLTVNSLDSQSTSSEKTKQIRANSDDLRRAKLLADAAFAATEHSQITFVEVPHGSQSARAMASYGMCIGILASLRHAKRPFIEVSALQVKMATVGIRTASKEAVIERAVSLYPHLNWPTKTIRGVTSLAMDHCSHMADAIGAIEAGLLTEEFSQLISLRSGAN